ncbi:MAG: hypothetical protein AVDCRST_MAG01-01-1971 [uncultured Rubrobacteraceae bacterium]|uniref:Uncharacterized protein n=1 Tax=uncultured Rubrobacteraceae bacterium TaxID=349277 RepID=A0A6J4PPU8_9ACTN|nr:MAG: hypothetical protein AVDCRST_MAG01-01-1971 [uncultured Rubrobacteraceae bacterium]
MGGDPVASYSLRNECQCRIRAALLAESGGVSRGVLRAVEDGVRDDQEEQR